MRHKIQYFAITLGILVLLTGCRGTPDAPAPELPQEPAKPSDSAPVFQAGTWFVSGKDSAAYYFFDADGASGRTASLENGTGVGFTYSVQDNQVTFRMGAEDAVVKGTLTKSDDTHASIVWERETENEETMRFISDRGSEDFRFYTNEDLCRMAAAYYIKTTGEDAPQAAADTDPETVSIQLYRNAGDHNSTCAWYQVNRQTAKGTDVNTGAEIDLSASDSVNRDD